MVIEPDFNANFVTSFHWAEQLLGQLAASSVLFFALSSLAAHSVRYNERERKSIQWHFVDCRGNDNSEEKWFRYDTYKQKFAEKNTVRSMKLVNNVVTEINHLNSVPTEHQRILKQCMMH